MERGGREEALRELRQTRAIANGNGVPSPEPIQKAPLPFPLQTLVLNVTNQCNLSCKYCYEFGEDRIATPEGKPKYMDLETAYQSIDFFFENSPGRKALQVTFFGGETLLNFSLVKEVIQYAKERAKKEERNVAFSLTTNGTLLRPAIIDFIVENDLGVTISIDGPKEMHDAQRTFHNGRGSYDIIEKHARELLKRNPSRPVAARVTLTSHAMDVLGIYRHLTQEIGFKEVGFAPVTTSPERSYALGSDGLDSVLDQFTELAHEYVEHAVRGERHGFTNVSDTLAEIHAGVSKAHPCGAGLGLVGVGPSGDIAPCHRFVDSDTHALGHVSRGIDREKQAAFLDRGHISQKPECHTCFARPLCSGGCYHEASVRYGDTGHPNLHFCEWIRGWTDTCLRVYGEIASRNPAYLQHFSHGN